MMITLTPDPRRPRPGDELEFLLDGVLVDLFIESHDPACSLGLSATSQQYFSLRTNQPPVTSQQYFSLRINQHQPSAASQTNRLPVEEGTSSQFYFAEPLRRRGEHPD
jgi:hypothetical protein